MAFEERFIELKSLDGAEYFASLRMTDFFEGSFFLEEADAGPRLISGGPFLFGKESE